MTQGGAVLVKGMGHPRKGGARRWAMESFLVRETEPHRKDHAQ